MLKGRYGIKWSKVGVQFMSFTHRLTLVTVLDRPFYLHSI
jgi:hypothetical protein